MRNIIITFILTLCAATTLPAQFVQGTLQGGPPAPGTKSRSPLNSLERAASNRYGATIMTDSFGNQRFTFYVSIWDTCLTYNPETAPVVGGPISVFVKKCATDSIWYIDYKSDVFFMGLASGGGPVENWYTVDDTTTDATRIAHILQNAEWVSVDPNGYIDMRMGDVAYGELYIDANETGMFNIGLGGANFVQVTPNGAEITTSNTASRAVDITTDTMNFVGSFDATRMQWNYLSDSTYMRVDSNKTVGFGQFPNLNNIQLDGTEKGFYYDPYGLSSYGGVSIMNGNGISGAYAKVYVDESAIYLYTQYQDGTYSLIDNGVVIATSQILSALVENNSGTLFDENATIDLEESNWRIRTNAPTAYSDTFSFVQAYQNSDGIRDIRYSALGEYDNGSNLSSSVYIGRAPSNGTEQRARTNYLAFGVQQNVSGGTYLFDWLKIDLSDTITTKDAIRFYNDRYQWQNAEPSPTVGDTSFHFWAGIGSGNTNPGFMTLDQVCAHCSESAVNWYNSNGTTTDNTRIATVTETATWLSDDVTVDGVYPFRFQLTGPGANEPEMMVWRFPAPNNDSLMLAQSDQEIFFRSTNRFLLWADNALVFQGDSIEVAGSAVEDKTKARYIFAGTNSGNPALKKFNADAATAGQFLASDGTDWVLTSGSSQGYILDGGNTTGANITIGTNDAFGLNLETNNVTRMAITGGASTGGQVTITNVTANTNTVSEGITIQTNSTGTAATSFGGGILFQGESSTTDNRDVGRVSAVWTTATDASRTSKIQFQTVNNAGALTDHVYIAPTGVGVSAAAGGSTCVYGNAAITPTTSFTIGNSAQSVTINSSATSGNPVVLSCSGNVTATTGRFGSSSFTTTSGTKKDWTFLGGYAPTSGTGLFYNLSFEPTINQTGGANGATGAITFEPTLTAVGGTWSALTMATSNSAAKFLNQTGSSTTSTHVGAFGFGATTVPTDKLEVTGNIALLTAGNKLKIATGSNASAGQSGAMTAGTITISTTAVTANSLIFLTHASTGGTQGILSVGTITAGTSFVINSSSALDTGTVNWWIIN